MEGITPGEAVERERLVAVVLIVLAPLRQRKLIINELING